MKYAVWLVLVVLCLSTGCASVAENNENRSTVEETIGLESVTSYATNAPMQTPQETPSATPVVTKPTATGMGDDDLFTDLPAAVLTQPRIVVRKSERRLLLYDGDTLVARMRIGLGRNPEGHKQQEGDSRTPEGEYYICTRNDQSSYYLSLGVSYPGIKDAEAGLAAGVITQTQYDDIVEAITTGKRPPWNTPLGGEIMLHGHGSGSDWTLGCVALENDDMDVLWKHCAIGTAVTIVP